MRELEIREVEGATKEGLLAQIAEALDFPDYFGGNFAALADCLGDVSTPTRITVTRTAAGSGPETDALFEKVWRVASRVALENPMLHVTLRWD